MRILVLSKRQYTNKDLIDDLYGRLYEIPKELARLGHEVSGLSLSYRQKNEGHILGMGNDDTLVDWYSFNLGKFIIPGLIRYLDKLQDLCDELKPDIIYACSDAPHVINGVRVAKKNNIPCVVDLYDNYESFKLTNIPGILPLFKRAVRKAAGVVCVSSNLLDYIEKFYCPKGLISVIPNGIPSKLFHPMDRQECRKELGLPMGKTLVGTAGSLGTSRGIDVLFDSFKELATNDPSIHLVLAGPIETDTNIPEDVNIHYLGEVEHEQVPVLFNALDVGVICNRDSSFGRYCFPQKAYEMLACAIPVVAANIGTMSELFSEIPECLYEPGNSQDSVQAIRKQLTYPSSHCIKISTWADLARDLERLFYEIVHCNPS
ncbi:MAG: glycosyltransferase [Desulfobacterales bacterium]|nr:glycosyltransferase [Desulfobacterales bacterium]